MNIFNIVVYLKTSYLWTIRKEMTSSVRSVATQNLHCTTSVDASHSVIVSLRFVFIFELGKIL